MTPFMLLSIGMMATLSLVSYLYCWRDIRGGKPHIISLRQITCIMDRAEINRLFGPPLPGYYYRLEPAVLKNLLKSRESFFHAECAADTLCLVGAWRYLMRDAEVATVGWFLLLAGLCQGINIFYSIWLLHKWGHQIREELEN